MMLREMIVRKAIHNLALLSHAATGWRSASHRVPNALDTLRVEQHRGTSVFPEGVSYVVPSIQRLIAKSLIEGVKTLIERSCWCSSVMYLSCAEHSRTLFRRLRAGSFAGHSVLRLWVFRYHADVLGMCWRIGLLVDDAIVSSKCRTASGQEHIGPWKRTRKSMTRSPVRLIGIPLCLSAVSLHWRFSGSTG